ncbi:MAG: hypothetical protein UT86_C0004G0025 [Candidatus Magasanikbacteria bacterium GW2011_GWC2_40_17]|uniref:Uncharacterized protein n=1 Tax=Candidatus Magasanikbacteria bacterium GW2011_GWA2_42_32 TaxID=1619039 RepID=A0A0G1A7S7_9BACT|nr:MAG: hypothetical protein UT86_C0004G0025 [Candidatus Magasanikbacteria bacterium GW2011_GWC2_40_17]KKS57085.1 MAG: hypothetical protein UV20_C0003G0025 [Candidatus Magasanikbacteria bacterium GW2011_GWA2_42_32]
MSAKKNEKGQVVELYKEHKEDEKLGRAQGEMNNASVEAWGIKGARAVAQTNPANQPKGHRP